MLPYSSQSPILRRQPYSFDQSESSLRHPVPHTQMRTPSFDSHEAMVIPLPSHDFLPQLYQKFLAQWLRQEIHW